VAPVSAPTDSVNGIERALDVLDLFKDAPGDGSLGVSEIARRLGLAKSVVHRMLQAFRAKGFVVLDAQTRRYSLGSGVARLTLAHVDRLGYEVTVRPRRVVIGDAP